jgi:hypothetical protein
MKRSTWFYCAGIVATFIGFAKPIEPLIEVGVALVVMGMISKPETDA